MCRAQSDPTCPGGRRCDIDPATRNALRRAAYAAAAGRPVRLRQARTIPEAPAPTPVPAGAPPAPQGRPTPLPARPHVLVMDGAVVGLNEDPGTARRQAAISERIGPDHRDAQGRILWGTITDPKLLSLRVADGKPAPRTLRIPAGIVDASGTIDGARLRTLPPEQQTRLRDLARRNFA